MLLQQRWQPKRLCAGSRWACRPYKLSSGCKCQQSRGGRSLRCSAWAAAGVRKAGGIIRGGAKAAGVHPQSSMKGGREVRACVREKQHQMQSLRAGQSVRGRQENGAAGRGGSNSRGPAPGARRRSAAVRASAGRACGGAPGGRHSSVPPPHLEQVLQHRLLRDLLQGGGAASSSGAGRVSAAGLGALATRQQHQQTRAPAPPRPAASSRRPFQNNQQAGGAPRCSSAPPRPWQCLPCPRWGAPPAPRSASCTCAASGPAAARAGGGRAGGAVRAACGQQTGPLVHPGAARHPRGLNPALASPP